MAEETKETTDTIPRDHAIREARREARRERRRERWVRALTTILSAAVSGLIARIPFPLRRK